MRKDFIMRKAKVLILGAACVVIALFQAPISGADNVATVGFMDTVKGLVLGAVEDTAASTSGRAILRNVGVGRTQPTRGSTVAGGIRSI